MRAIGPSSNTLFTGETPDGQFVIIMESPRHGGNQPGLL